MTLSTLNPKQEGPSIYTDPDFHFSSRIPAGWLLDSSGQQGTRIIIFASPPNVDFRANINVMIHKLAAITPAEFLTLSRLQLKQMTGPPNLEIDHPAAQPPGAHIFEWHAPMGSLHLKMRQLITFRPPLAFVVTATALFNDFDQFRQDFEAALDSFQFDVAPEAPAE